MQFKFKSNKYTWTGLWENSFAKQDNCLLMDFIRIYRRAHHKHEDIVRYQLIELYSNSSIQLQGIMSELCIQQLLINIPHKTIEFIIEYNYRL